MSHLVTGNIMEVSIRFIWRERVIYLLRKVEHSVLGLRLQNKGSIYRTKEERERALVKKKKKARHGGLYL
jgi:hypothetical protein